jgi:D-erythrulose 1-phosphate 3-epimerase
MAELRLGINNGFAMKRWPEPWAWAEIVGERLGLRYVQVSFDVLDPGWPGPCVTRMCDRVCEAASAHGLIVHSTFTGLVGYAQNLLAHPDAEVRAHGLRWFESGVALTARLGAEATGGYMGALSVDDHADPHRRAEVRQALVSSVRSLARTASLARLRALLWEPMPVPREIPHTPEEAMTLLAEVNHESDVPVELCFDLGHCCAWDLPPKADPHAWLEELLPWTAVIHLQQTDGRGDHHWPFTREFAATGIVEPRRVVDIARQSPFETVYLFLEICHAHETSDEQVIDDLKASVDTWASVL